MVIGSMMGSIPFTRACGVESSIEECMQIRVCAAVNKCKNMEICRVKEGDMIRKQDSKFYFTGSEENISVTLSNDVCFNGIIRLDFSCSFTKENYCFPDSNECNVGFLIRDPYFCPVVSKNIPFGSYDDDDSTTDFPTPDPTGLLLSNDTLVLPEDNTFLDWRWSLLLVCACIAVILVLLFIYLRIKAYVTNRMSLKFSKPVVYASTPLGDIPATDVISLDPRFVDSLDLKAILDNSDLKYKSVSLSEKTSECCVSSDASISKASVESSESTSVSIP